MDDSPVVLVTGVSSGTGLCAAVELARRGALVFGTMRDPARADALLAACREAGVTVTVVGLDVRSASSVREAVASVVGRAGRLDVLVNNAAAFVFAPVEFTTPEEVLTLVETNLVGPIRMIQAVLPIMRAQERGRIVNVGSVSAEPKFGVPLAAVYGATKGGLRVLSLDLNKELQPLGIDVILCEGGIGGRSAMFEPLHDGVASLGHGRRRLRRRRELGPVLRHLPRREHAGFECVRSDRGRRLPGRATGSPTPSGRPRRHRHGTRAGRRAVPAAVSGRGGPAARRAPWSSRLRLDRRTRWSSVSQTALVR